MSSEKYIVIKRGTESVLYRRAEDGPEFQSAARSGDHDGLVEIASMLNRVEDIESSITELATVEDKPEPPESDPARPEVVAALRRINTAMKEWDVGWVTSRKTCEIIEKILKELEAEKGKIN